MSVTLCIISTALLSLNWMKSKQYTKRSYQYETLCYNRELDELEREDFTRLKMVKKKKEEQIKQTEIDKKEALANAEEDSKAV